MADHVLTVAKLLNAYVTAAPRETATGEAAKLRVLVLVLDTFELGVLRQLHAVRYGPVPAGGKVYD